MGNKDGIEVADNFRRILRCLRIIDKADWDDLLMDFIEEGGRVDGTRSGIIIRGLCRWFYYRQQCDCWQWFVIASCFVAEFGWNKIGEGPLEGILGGLGIIDSNEDVHCLEGRRANWSLRDEEGGGGENLFVRFESLGVGLRGCQ